jgi:hypothetical protein
MFLQTILCETECSCQRFSRLLPGALLAKWRSLRGWDREATVHTDSDTDDARAIVWAKRMDRRWLRAHRWTKLTSSLVQAKPTCGIPVRRI